MASHFVSGHSALKLVLRDLLLYSGQHLPTIGAHPHVHTHTYTYTDTHTYPSPAHIPTHPHTNINTA